MAGRPVEWKTPEERVRVCAAGRVVAAALAAARARVAAGVELVEVDAAAAAVVAEHGATPVGPGLRPGGALSASVGEVLVRGVPDGRRLAAGEVVSLSCAVRCGGWHALAAETVPVGAVGAVGRGLLGAVEQALVDGVAAVRPGGAVADVAYAVGVVALGGGFGVPGLLCGHGVGRELWEPPVVPSEVDAAGRVPLRPGVVCTVEPVLVAGGDAAVTWGGDGSVRSGSGAWAAHAAHTVVVTEDGPVVATRV
ncbi:M24 family metallopeptidase [Salinifilum ghardaiensis]